MKDFELTLNLADNFTIGGFNYPVIKNNLQVGTCRFNSNNSTVTGLFSLTNGFKKEQYLKYNTDVKDGKKSLVNLEFSDFETSESIQCITPIK
ncbi:MAG: hypothetical protein JWQ38_1655 [Flavipsychrobacter sp.]|nr:hypothetical protein [Flavipsychrobacter sp.]